MGMFSRLDPHVQRVSGWLTVAGFLLSGLYTLLASAAPYFEDWSWPGLVLFGIVSALATLFALAAMLAVGAYGFRLIRPVPAEAAPIPSPEPQKENFAVTQILNEDRFQELDRGLTKLEQCVGSLEGKIMQRLREIEARHSLSTDYTRQQVSSIFQALAAIAHLDQLASLASRIEDTAAPLTTPTTMEAHLTEDQWEDWEKDEGKWRELVTKWCAIAECYVSGIIGQVWTTGEYQLRQSGRAKVTQFPDEGAFTAYKIFWIRLKNWREVRPNAERAVYQAAYEGGTAPSRPVLLGDVFLGADHESGGK